MYVLVKYQTPASMPDFETLIFKQLFFFNSMKWHKDTTTAPYFSFDIKKGFFDLVVSPLQCIILVCAKIIMSSIENIC